MLWISGAGGLQSLMFQGIRARFQKALTWAQVTAVLELATRNLEAPVHH
jgi:hypothetical protein